MSRTPWWVREALLAGPPPAPAPPPGGDVSVDVAIVGGGFTGLWSALALLEREPSLRVAVLEQDAVGSGPSGRNGGFLHGYWTHLAPLLREFGPETAVSVCRLADRIIPAVEAFARERGEDVGLRAGGRLRVSALPAHDAAIQRSVDLAAELGVEEECVPLDGEEIRRRLGSERFRRGAFVRDGAIVQPARLAFALRRAVLDAGVRLFEHTPATRVEPGAVTTPHGRVTAGHVIVATNAWMARWRPVARRMTAFSSYIALTEPVPELLAEMGWRGDESITDGRMFVHYFRPTHDGRIAMGTASGPISSQGRIDDRLFVDAAACERAAAGLRWLLPRLRDVRVEHAWGGPIDVSSDHLPYWGTLPGARVHYAAGFSGHGVGPSWLAAQSLASIVTGRDDEYARLPFVDRAVSRLPPEPLKTLGGALVRRAILAREVAEQDGRRAPAAAHAVARIPALIGMQLGTR